MRRVTLLGTFLSSPCSLFFQFLAPSSASSAWRLVVGCTTWSPHTSAVLHLSYLQTQGRTVHQTELGVGQRVQFSDPSGSLPLHGVLERLADEALIGNSCFRSRS